MADPVDGATIERARASVRADAPRMIELLQKLVRIPSVNPKFLADAELNREADVQDVIAAELTAMGFAVTRSFTLAGRPNLVGRWTGSDARSLALCGHVDVVPQGDEKFWSFPPFGAEINAGRLYGRGSADMKAGLVAALAACRAIRDLGVTLDGRLEFHSVVDEEVGGFGAMEVARDSRGLGAVLLTEPSGGAVRPWAGGLEWVRVTLRGRAGHSARRFASIYPSDPAVATGPRSVNAIELGARLLASLRELETQWGVSKHFPGMPPGMNTISPGVMIAGCGEGPDGLPTLLANPAMVPDICIIDFDLKFLPHETSAEIRREFEDWVARFRRGRSLAESPSTGGQMAARRSPLPACQHPCRPPAGRRRLGQYRPFWTGSDDRRQSRRHGCCALRAIRDRGRGLRPHRGRAARTGRVCRAIVGDRDGRNAGGDNPALLRHGVTASRLMTRAGAKNASTK